MHYAFDSSSTIGQLLYSNCKKNMVAIGLMVAMLLMLYGVVLHINEGNNIGLYKSEEACSIEIPVVVG